MADVGYLADEYGRWPVAQLKPESDPVDGLGTPELFNNTVRFQDFFRRLVPMLVMLFLFTTLICGLVLGYTGMGATRWLLAVLVAAGFSYFLYRRKKRQFETTWPKSTLELSPHGAVSVSGGVRIDLPWSRIHQIGKSDIMGPLRIGSGNDVAALAASAAAASVRRSADALIGAGTLTLTRKRPPWCGRR